MHDRADMQAGRMEEINMCGWPVAALFANQRMCVGERRKYPGTTIVTDSVTSNGLTSFITEQVCPESSFVLRGRKAEVLGEAVL